MPPSGSSARRASTKVARRPAAGARRTAACGPTRQGAGLAGADRDQRRGLAADHRHRRVTEPLGRASRPDAAHLLGGRAPRQLLPSRHHVRPVRAHPGRHLGRRRRRRHLPAAHLHVHPRRDLHIGFNMFALWFLGPQLEMVLGRVRYLALYLLSGLVGSAMVYWFSDPTTADPGRLGRDLRPDGCAARPGLQGPRRDEPAAGVDRAQRRDHVLRALDHLLAGPPRRLRRRRRAGGDPGLRAPVPAYGVAGRRLRGRQRAGGRRGRRPHRRR